jgi:hypothetical protein
MSYIMIISKIIVVVILLLQIIIMYDPLFMERVFLFYKALSTNKQKFLHTNFFNIFRNIPNIDSNSFNQDVNIDISKELINEYKIINLQENISSVKNIINSVNVKNHIITLLKSMIRHTHINGRKVKLEDCVVVDLLRAKGQYFKNFHTDVEWGVFDKSDGFQMWYLYENDKPHGNMFIIDTDKVIPSSCLSFNKNNIKIHEQCEKKHICDIKYSDVINNIKYLNMKPGECLIFGKSLYHMSDIRSSPNRNAINFRVLIKDADGGIPINLSQKCTYNYNFQRRLKNHKVKNNKLYVNTFDLIDILF